MFSWSPRWMDGRAGVGKWHKSTQPFCPTSPAVQPPPGLPPSAPLPPDPGDVNTLRCTPPTAFQTPLTPEPLPFSQSSPTVPRTCGCRTWPS